MVFAKSKHKSTLKLWQLGLSRLSQGKRALSLGAAALTLGAVMATPVF